MMAEFDYEEAVRNFAAARREVELVEAELTSEGSNLERVSRLKWRQQAFMLAEKDLAAKIKAWEQCKERERSGDQEE